LTPAMALNSSAERFDGPPEGPDEKLSEPGLALARLISSLTDWAKLFPKSR